MPRLVLRLQWACFGGLVGRLGLLMIIYNIAADRDLLYISCVDPNERYLIFAFSCIEYSNILDSSFMIILLLSVFSYTTKSKTRLCCSLFNKPCLLQRRKLLCIIEIYQITHLVMVLSIFV